MKNHKVLKISTVAILFLIACINCFSSHAQIIKEKYDKLMLSENFDSINTHWTTLANADNLFIVQDGEYILQRKAPTAPFAIIANLDQEFGNFRAVTSLKLDNTAGEGSFSGFMFMIQNEGEGGFLLEVNKVKEYRLRQIVNGSYKYLTGSSKNGGWIKSGYLNEAGQANMVEIRNMSRNYDLYLNNNFVQSFSEPSYKSGKFGIIVGPSTRSKIDFLYVFTMTSPEDLAKMNVAAPDPNNSNQTNEAPDVIELTESIIRLKTQINRLNEENEDLRKTISAMKSGDQEKDVTIKNFEKQVKQQQEQLARKEQTLDSLTRKNNELQKYKELAGGNENGDLVIALSKSLKAEKEKNLLLEQQIKDLKEKNDSDSTPVKNNKPLKNDSGSAVQKKDSTVFKLPVEN